MNLTGYEVTPLHAAFEAVRDAARGRGVDVAGSELIGLIPRAALDAATGVDLMWENFREDMVLEERLRIARDASA